MKKKTIVLSVLIVCVCVAGTLLYICYAKRGLQGRLKIDTVAQNKRLHNLQQQLAQTPDDPQIHLKLAALYSSWGWPGKPGKSIEHYLKAAQLAPDDAQVLKAVAHAFSGKKRNHEVIGYCERILALDPSMAEETYSLMAYSYYELGEYDKAVQYYEKKSLMQKSLWLGKAYYELGRYDDSIKIFETFPSLKDIPRNKAFGMNADESGVAFYYMGLSYMKLGRTKQGKQKFKEALKAFNKGQSKSWRKKEIDDIKKYLNNIE